MICHKGRYKFSKYRVIIYRTECKVICLQRAPGNVPVEIILRQRVPGQLPKETDQAFKDQNKIMCYAAQRTSGQLFANAQLILSPQFVCTFQINR